MFQTSNKLNSNKGFSLAEMMIAVCVSVIFVSAVTYLAQDMFVTFGRIDRASSVAEIVAEVRVVFIKGEQCSLNLAGAIVRPAQAPAMMGTPAEIPRLDIFNLESKARASQIVIKNQKMSGITVESILLIPGREVEPGLILSSLAIGYKSPKKDQAEFRYIPLMVRTFEGKVSECWIREAQSSVDHSQVCDVLTDGALNYYDTELGTCFLRGAKWVDGTFDKATCPPGSLFPDKAQADHTCNASTPKGFQDTFPTTELPLANGTTVTAKRPYFITHVNASTKTCHCDWAADLPLTEVQASKCQVLCIIPQPLSGGSAN